MSIITAHSTNPHRQALRQIVGGLYDLQKLRIATGNRLCTQIRLRLGQMPGELESTITADARKLLKDVKATHAKFASAIANAVQGAPPADEKDDIDLEDDAAPSDKLEAGIQDRIMKLVRDEYKAMTDGKKNFPSKRTFKGSLVISQYTELVLADSYLQLEAQEERTNARLTSVLEEFPVYNEFLEPIKGCGALMSAMLVAYLDPYVARYPSSFWKFCGLDVVQNGDGSSDGRGRFASHQIDREYTTREGKLATRKSITFNPIVKTKTVGVLASCLVKAQLRVEWSSEDKKTRKRLGVKATGKYGQIFLDYKNRLENHAKYGKHNDGVIDEARCARLGSGDKDKKEQKMTITSPGRRLRMALRYMTKMFLMDLHIAWRALEGLPVSQPYHVAKLGMRDHGTAA